MTDEELDDLELEQSKKLHFEWIFPIFLKPRATFQKISQHSNGVWLTPLLLLTVLLIILALVSSPIRAQNSQMGATLPPDFEYYPPEQQQKIIEGQQNMGSPVLTLVFPAAGSIIGLWLSWLVLGSILHLSLTFSGGNSRTRAALNLVGWAMMPFAIRYIVQILAILFTRQLITSPGLSGFFPTDMGNLRLFLSLIMGFIDLYFIWHVILLVVGVKTFFNITTSKTWIAVLIVVVIMLLLQAVPGFVMSKIGGAGGSSPYFFF